MRLDTLQSELSKLDARRAKLQAQIKKESDSVFTELPRKVGLKNVDALVLALVPYTSANLRSKLGGGATPSVAKKTPAAKSAPSKPATAPSKSPTKHSDELKAEIKQAFQAGKPAGDLSKQHGIPLGTLKKWKRKWGLTSTGATARKKK